jgi:hypothetical protein
MGHAQCDGTRRAAKRRISIDIQQEDMTIDMEMWDRVWDFGSTRSAMRTIRRCLWGRFNASGPGRRPD